MKKRIGNDIKGLEWSIFRNIQQGGKVVVAPEDFTECFGIEIVCYNTETRSEKIVPEYTINEGVILMNIPADSLTLTGPYAVLLSYKKADSALNGKVSTHAIDWKGAFIMVPESTMEDEAGQGKTSMVNYAVDGKNAYDYWLEHNQGTEADFLSWMQRPALNAAQTVDSYISDSRSVINALSQKVTELETDVSDLLKEPQDILQFEGYLNFPNIGRATTLYIDILENISYRWDSTQLKYYSINQIDIQIINGGE